MRIRERGEDRGLRGINGRSRRKWGNGGYCIFTAFFFAFFLGGEERTRSCGFSVYIVCTVSRVSSNSADAQPAMKFGCCGIRALYCRIRGYAIRLLSCCIQYLLRPCQRLRDHQYQQGDEASMFASVTHTRVSQTIPLFFSSSLMHYATVFPYRLQFSRLFVSDAVTRCTDPETLASLSLLAHLGSYRLGGREITKSAPVRPTTRDDSQGRLVILQTSRCVGCGPIHWRFNVSGGKILSFGQIRAIVGVGTIDRCLMSLYTRCLADPVRKRRRRTLCRAVNNIHSLVLCIAKTLDDPNRVSHIQR